MSPGGLEHGKQTASWSFGGYCTLIVSDWELMIELRTRRMGGLGPVCCLSYSDWLVSGGDTVASLGHLEYSRQVELCIASMQTVPSGRPYDGP